MPSKIEQEVIDAARAYVDTTTYYRQRLDSRPEFERLARALIEYRALQIHESEDGEA